MAAALPEVWTGADEYVAIVVFRRLPPGYAAWDADSVVAVGGA